MKERIEKWKRMETAGDPAATAYLKEITVQANAEGKIDEMNEALEYLVHSADRRLDAIKESVASYTLHGPDSMFLERGMLRSQWL